MNPKPETSLREVFLQAAEIENLQAREAYLNDACGGNVSFRRRVERLLAADSDAGDPPDASPSTATREGDMIGAQIGPYKLLQQIGEGGCGAVYMAEQEKPVRRKVALKILKLGMDTKQIVARFEAERQALAMMDHPSIARVFDAGATDTGRPYFVMELVRGIKITDYCDEHQLSTRQRLDLFIQVCHAVQHAHQKGMIHRDLKPSNVLVTELDGEPLPKVIDFGIAKAVEGRLTDNTLFTAFEQLVGTPSYMSPEQASLVTSDIDTRTDIYSLGVMLYQLLTGDTPFDTKSLLASGLDEMRRTIQEVAPLRPSTRLTQKRSSKDRTGSAQSAVRNPQSAIDRDLDWIVMKCLEKERGRRYETANGLAMDLQRHLSNEPVVARPPSRLYEFQKTVQRHWVGFGAAAAIVLVISLGALVSTSEAIRATRAETVAKTEAAKATAVSDLMLELMSSGDPGQLRGTDYTVRELLDEFSIDLSQRLANQPAIEAEMREKIGVAYSQLGLEQTALPHLEKALALKRQLYGSDSLPVVELLLHCAGAWFSYGLHVPKVQNLDEVGIEAKWERARPYLREAQETARQHGIEWSESLIAALSLEEGFLEALGRYSEAEPVLEEILSVAETSPNLEGVEKVKTIHRLAQLRNGQGRYEEAEELARRALEMWHESLPPDHIDKAWCLRVLATACEGRKKLPEARTALEEALKIFLQHYDYEHGIVYGTMGGLCRILERQEDWVSLEALLKKMLAVEEIAALKAELDGGATTVHVPVSLCRLSCAVDAQNRPKEAKAYLERAAEFLSLHPPGPDMDTFDLAEGLRKARRFPEAEEFYRHSLRVRTTSHHKDVLGNIHRLAGLLLNSGRPEEARELAQRGLALKKQFEEEGFPLEKGWVNAFAWTLHDVGLQMEAESLQRELAEQAAHK